jgi:1-acyl-sn-glycerol-3-phosphate acyltransferase
MTVVGIAVRLLVLGSVLVVVVPPLLIGLRLGWPAAGWLPVYVYRLFLRLFRVRVVVQGQPPGGPPTLVLSNHVSWLDIPVLGSLLPLSFIAKSEVAGWPVIGFYARLQRCIFIDRARKSHTTYVNTEVAHRLAQGDVIVLFPEGTTSDGNRLLPFRSALIGAARAALAEPSLQRIYLQPLAIVYARRNGLPVTRRERPALAWYGDMDLAPHLAALLREGSIDVVVRWCEPIPFDAGSDRKRATAAAETAVRIAIGDALRTRNDTSPPKRLFSPGSRTPKESAIQPS